MNSTITLPEIAAALAAAAGVDNDTATRFVAQLFAAVETQLASTRKAEVKGLGTFTVTDAGISFVPDAALAAAVNAPFAMFAPVELSEEAAREFALEQEPQPESTAAEAEIEEKVEAVAEVVPPAYVPEPAPVAPAAEEPAEAEDSAPEAELQEEPAEEESEEIAEASHTVAEQPEPQIIYVARRNPWPWVVALIALVAGFAGGYCLGHYSGTLPGAAEKAVDAFEVIVEEDEPAVPAVVPDTVSVDTPEDSVAPEPAAEPKAEAKREPVYDTVGSSRFLTTIARDHYGRKDYWVFIYEANASRLKSPNLIAPGTRVEIPYLGEHPALDPELRARARKLAAEFSERYNL